MSFNHEAVAALPVASNADKALIRALCTRRFAYCLAATDVASNFVAVDPDTGVIPLNLIQNNILFQYDSTDTTTASDGVTCLVSSDGKRFKSATVTPPYSVLTRATVAQPGSPAVGDTYLIPTAATGTDWAGKDGSIGIYTARGWVFATSPIGRFLYVKDETAFYHRNAAGNWTAGVGSIALGANSVNLTNVLGANASYIIKVENQTTNAPPASPTAPTAYIIGPSPTGSWAGNAGRLAICLTAGTFTIITPVAGDVVFDKAQAAAYTFIGASWVTQQGAFRVFAKTPVQGNGSATSSGTLGYAFDDTTGPTTSNVGMKDQNLITYTASKVGADIRFLYRFSLSGTINVRYTIALFVDSVSASVDWAPGDTNANGACSGIVEFIVTTSDILPHTYFIRACRQLSFADAILQRRQITIEERF